MSYPFPLLSVIVENGQLLLRSGHKLAHRWVVFCGEMVAESQYKFWTRFRGQVTVRPALIPGTFQQKVKYVVGKGRILGEPQMIGKNKVHLAPANR